MSHVLVVDDEFGVAEVLDDILTDEGHHVTTAINGQRGMERIQENTPDVVFLDFMMPILDGPGLLQALRADPRWADLPVVLMSSLPEATVRERAIGFTCFMRKPFRIETVLRTLALALRRNS